MNFNSKFALNIVTKKKFIKDIKAFKYRLLRPHGIYLRIKHVRLEFTYTYISKLILAAPELKNKLYKNNYFLFLADVEHFKYFKGGTEEALTEIKEKELLRYVMSFARITDKYLLSHIINNFSKVKIKNNIKDDIKHWFDFFYQSNDNIFKDYCSFVKILQKINKTHGFIKTDYDMEIAMANTIKKVNFKKEKTLCKFKNYDEPSLDWI